MTNVPKPTIRPELLDLLSCPACTANKLQLVSKDDQTYLICPQCHSSYGFAHGIPLLYHNDASWITKQREAEGWVAMWQALGMYDQDIPVDPNVPFGATVEPWITIERMFRGALFQMDLRGGERILDVGAGEGWASQHFALRGAEAVAIDVVPDPGFGLARSWKRMQITNTFFDLIIGDNERLPFAENSFDYVFASNALHHHDYLERLFGSIYRVLKPGGRLIAIGDPLATIYQQESDLTDGDREKSFGIIERRRRFVEYFVALWQAGFRQIHAEDDKTFWLKNSELYPWMDQQRAGIEQHATLGSRQLTKLLTWGMLRLPRPFALALLLCLREGGLLMISGQKPKSNA
ncbi:MAG: class I SAM-dependent methyltransferase [Oscillochloridaceae bacterium umkhey_bin13]